MVSGGLKLFQVVNCLSEKVVPSEKVGYAKAFAWYTFSTRNALHFRLYQPHFCPAHTCSRENIHCHKIYNMHVYVYKIHMQGCRTQPSLVTNLVTNLSPNLVTNLVNHQIW